jgi:hypothetical protein
MGIGGVVMNLFFNIIYKVLLAASFAASLYIGFYVGDLAQDSFGFPWNYVALLLTFLACYAFFVCIVLNQVIFRKIIEQNTPIFNHDDVNGSIGYKGEEAQLIPWQQVVKIEILTTDKGPWEEDVWWLFYLANVDDPIAIPQGANNHNELFNVLEKHFTDVNMDTLFAGMVSVDNALFNVWSLK